MDRHELERIRLVATRYRQLQGLRGVALGSSLILGFGMYLLLRAWIGYGWYVGVIISFVLLIPAMLWCDRYYATTFGRVRQPPRTAWLTGLSVVGFTTIGMVERVIRGESSMLAPFILYLAGFMWVAIRDWRIRPHVVLEVAASALAIAFQLTPAATAHADVAIASGFLLVGLAAIPTGWLDHQLLVTTMRRDNAAQPERSK